MFNRLVASSQNHLKKSGLIFGLGSGLGSMRTLREYNRRKKKINGAENYIRKHQRIQSQSTGFGRSFDRGTHQESISLQPNINTGREAFGFGRGSGKGRPEYYAGREVPSIAAARAEAESAARAREAETARARKAGAKAAVAAAYGNTFGARKDAVEAAARAAAEAAQAESYENFGAGATRATAAEEAKYAGVATTTPANAAEKRREEAEEALSKAKAAKEAEAGAAAAARRVNPAREEAVYQYPTSDPERLAFIRLEASKAELEAAKAELKAAKLQEEAVQIEEAAEEAAAKAEGERRRAAAEEAAPQRASTAARVTRLDAAAEEVKEAFAAMKRVEENQKIFDALVDRREAYGISIRQSDDFYKQLGIDMPLNTKLTEKELKQYKKLKRTYERNMWGESKAVAEARSRAEAAVKAAKEAAGGETRA